MTSSASVPVRPAVRAEHRRDRESRRGDGKVVAVLARHGPHQSTATDHTPHIRERQRGRERAVDEGRG